MKIHHSSLKVPYVLKTGILLCAASFLSAASRGASITVPNGSFESQVAGPPFYANINIDSWQKAPKPDYFNENTFGFLWVQTAGAFFDTNPYSNRDGSQGAYMLSFPGVSLRQDYDTTDWRNNPPSHDFNSTFEVGKWYTLTLGVFGKSMVDGAILELSLYYRDGTNLVTVGATDVFYHAADFPLTSPMSLHDIQVNVPIVQASDAWAGKNIGIKIESVYGDGNGYWDMDNVRLTAVPEPASVSLLGLALGGLWFARGRRR